MSSSRGPLWKQIATAAGVATLFGVFAGVMIDLGPWYQSLRKPEWKPPDLLFGPVWMVIYSCAVAAAVIGWRRAPTRPDRQRLVGLFVLNGLLNVLWMFLFFRAKRPDWAVIEDAALTLSVIALMVGLWRYAKPASLLLAPYLAWTIFAWLLNYAIVQLNGPFG